MLTWLKSRVARRSWIAGCSAIGLALGVKGFYAQAGADQLLWVLAPSAWLAARLGGIDLVYERGAGFISHTHHLVVGPSCAGVNFLVICFLCLYFSFARHFAATWRWFLSAIAISFAGTIAANSLRIFLSAHLWNADFYREWLTQEDMHRLAGIVIYYASLLTLYVTVESRIGARSYRMTPLVWYLAISLGIPLAGRLVIGAAPGFAGHAVWVAGVALLLTLVMALPTARRNRVHFRA
jgi:exosortase K